VRIGNGFDAHRFGDDQSRALWLALVEVPGAPGLEGHSDGDVVTHALCDAMLGAAGLGDLGRHFPSDDERWRGAASRLFLDHVLSLIAGSGLVVESGDLTVICQRPRLAPYLERMSQALTQACGAPIGVKATTTDYLGAVGRGEGIAAMAVCLLAAS